MRSRRSAAVPSSAALVAGVLLREAPYRPECGDRAHRAPTLRDGALWLLAGGSSLYLTAQIAIASFVVLFLHGHRGLSTHLAAGVLAVIKASSRIRHAHRRPAAGLDRTRTRIAPLRTVGLALATASVVAAALVDAPLVVLVPALVVDGVLGFSWNGLSFTAAAERAGAARSGAALGFQQTTLAVVGAIVPLVFAALVMATSWRVAFAAAAVGPIAGVLLLRRVPEVKCSAKLREYPKCRRSRRQLVELRVDAAELARAVLVAGVDLRPAHRQRAASHDGTAPKPSRRASAARSMPRSISTPNTFCMQPMNVCPCSS